MRYHRLKMTLNLWPEIFFPGDLLEQGGLDLRWRPASSALTDSRLMIRPAASNSPRCRIARTCFAASLVNFT